MFSPPYFPDGITYASKINVLIKVADYCKIVASIHSLEADL
jgi:hypothetical protein